MPDLTSRLALKKPRGGSSGSAPAEQVDIDVINGNMDSLDAAVGAASTASTSRPATPFNGQFVRETDTGDLVVYDQGSSQWVTASGGAPRSLANASQPSGAVGAAGTIAAVTSTTFNASKVQNVIVTVHATLSAPGNAGGNLYLKLNNVDILIPATGRYDGLTSTSRLFVSLTAVGRCVVGSNTALLQATSDTGGNTVTFNNIRLGVSTY